MLATGWLRPRRRLSAPRQDARVSRASVRAGGLERLKRAFASNAVEVLWALFAIANWVAMIAWPAWETIPFHFVWISVTIVYGFRVWSPAVTAAILSAVILATGASILADAFAGVQLWGELFEVPLMSAMFLAMVWHARRRQSAMRQVEALADMRASLLERQERFLHDASHELRTPVTIARGHLELLSRETDAPELIVAIDELERMERIIDRLLLLANVAAIARAHGGRCTVERRDGETVFSLALPVGAEVEAEPAPAERLAVGLAP